MSVPPGRGCCVAFALLTACSTWHSQPLPNAASRPTPGDGRLSGGFARVDITPPPGVGMGGSGPEGRRSTGYRTRLYAGAMVLQDPTGERIALVVADLAHVSANLHRLVAARVVERTGIGSDRLIISATHTHSGPAHFYGERQYNTNVSRVPGFDPAMVDHLVKRITEAVTRAADSLRPVVVAWGERRIVGATTNRSLEAFCLDPEESIGTACRRNRPELGVDTMLFMLRVDELKAGETRPLGSYSVFALHGTSIPSVNTLLDGDAHVRIVERLARHGDSLLARQRDSMPRRPTVHILANGAEGDVNPRIRREQCETPRLGLFDPVSMPRGPGEAVDFLEPSPRRVEHCIEHALHQVDTLVERVAAPAIALYDSLGGELTSDVPIRRAFTAVWLLGNDGLCQSPAIGSSTAAGAEGLESRVNGWRWLFPFVPVALEEGGAAVRVRPGECQSPKRVLLGPLQSRLVVGEHGFPEMAQLTVVRIGSVLLGAVPAEVTTVAGRRMRAAMAQAAKGDSAPSLTVLVGLANGFLQYVNTEEEYQWQSYEGGSNLYGPGTGGFLQRRLAELAGSLPDPLTGPSPVADVPPMVAYPGPPSVIMPSPTAGPVKPALRRIELACRGGRLIGRWLDLAPGRLFPRSTPLLELEQESGAGDWERIGVDGDGRLEVRAVGPRGKRGFSWNAVWTVPAQNGRFRLSRLEDSAQTSFSATVSCGVQ
jgi:neutral ceramidase